MKKATKKLPKAAAKKKQLAAKRPPAKRKKPPLKPQVLTKATRAPKAKANRTPKAEVVTMRGPGLVELAIAADRERRDPAHPPRPLTRAQIDQLAMPDGTDIPPSLARWLGYDTLDIFEGSQPSLRWRSFADMMREQFDDDTAQQFADFGKLLTRPCLWLGERSFLYAGKPDAHGEYPIFVVDTDELPWIGLAYPGFDAYIANERVANVIAGDYLDAWQHQHWAPHLEHHARQNFRGFKALDYQQPDHLDGPAAAQNAMAELLGDELSSEDFDELKA
jgi:hypothetical protein